MAALAQDRSTPRRTGRFVSLPVAAATIIYAGAMVARDAAGNAVPASDTAGLVVLGRAEAQIDNQLGAAGDLAILVRGGVYAYAHSGLTPAAIGKPAFVSDDQTVAASSTNAVLAGYLVDVDDSGAWVALGSDDGAGKAQANSVATTVADAVIDLNALLAKLRAARLIAS